MQLYKATSAQTFFSSTKKALPGGVRGLEADGVGSGDGDA